MKVIRQLFVDDMKRIFSNLITGLIVLGLVLLPSIFSWYNVLACWDVFHNTGNLKVAVVNNDEGYQSDLVPMKVNMGEQIASSLRANEQMDWIFTDEDDAIDGAKSGKILCGSEKLSRKLQQRHDDVLFRRIGPCRPDLLQQRKRRTWLLRSLPIKVPARRPIW